MNKNNILQLTRFSKSDSILVINETGIYRLFCPFKAVCIKAVNTYAVNQEVVVVAVKTSIDLKLVYLIQGKGYYHHYFRIVSTTRGTKLSFN